MQGCALNLLMAMVLVWAGTRYMTTRSRAPLSVLNPPGVTAILRKSQQNSDAAFFAHIRDATIGMPVSQANCHPFQSGSYLWMHNGHLDEFDKCRRLLMASLSDTSFNMIKGNTDTEHLFALFMDEVEHQQVSNSRQLLEALSRTIVRINSIRKESGCNLGAQMNFALSNGVCSLFTRLSMNSEMAPPTLHYQQKGEALIVASEPLSETEDWLPVNNGEVLIQETCKPMRIEALKI